MRIDNALEVIATLADRLKNTLEAPTSEVTSPIQLLKIPSAKVEPTRVSPETSLVLSAIEHLSDRIEQVERDSKRLSRSTAFQQLRDVLDGNRRGPIVQAGVAGEHPRFGRGTIQTMSTPSQAIVAFDQGVKARLDVGQLTFVIDTELPKDNDGDKQVAAAKE